MANKIRWAVLLLCAGAVCACTTPAAQSDTDDATRRHDTPVLNEQTKALEQAKSLSRRLQKTADDRRRQIEMETR